LGGHSYRPGKTPQPEKKTVSAQSKGLRERETNKPMGEKKTTQLSAPNDTHNRKTSPGLARSGTRERGEGKKRG